MSATQRIHLNPNAPRAPMMSHGGGGGGGGYTPDPVRPRSGGRAGPQSGDDDLLATVKGFTSKVEDIIETYSQVRMGLRA